MNMPVDTLADPIAAHAKEMLAHLGEDPRRAGLRDTPQRFANALRFLTGGYEAEPRDVVGNGVFDAEGEGVVLVRDMSSIRCASTFSVLAEARHLCMAMRGVEKQHSATATRALRGVYAHDAAARQEVLSMIRER